MITAADSFGAITQLAKQLAAGDPKQHFTVGYDDVKKAVVIHQFGHNTKVKVFDVRRGALVNNINLLAAQFGWHVKYRAEPRQQINTAYMIGVTDRIDQAIPRLIQPYGLRATYVQAAKTVSIE